MRRIRLVIADRRPIVLQGFVSLFGAQPDFEVVACCLDGANCLASIRRLTPDVVLLEDGFTDVTASDILAVMDDEGLSSRLVFFTATVACGDLARAMATGACGAISMSAKPEALVQSLRLEKPGSDLARVGNQANGIASFGNNVLAVLTVNERTIMDLVAEGLSDSEIARVLGVFPGHCQDSPRPRATEARSQQPDGALRACPVAPLRRDEYPGSCDPGCVGGYSRRQSHRDRKFHGHGRKRLCGSRHYQNQPQRNRYRWQPGQSREQGSRRHQRGNATQGPANCTMPVSRLPRVHLRRQHSTRRGRVRVATAPS